MKDSFTNSRGIVVKCKPVAAEYTKSIADNIRSDFIERGEPIEPPARWVPKMGGGTMREELTSFIDPKSGELLDGLDDEEKERLSAHLEALGRLNSARLEALVNAFCLEGIDLPDGVPLGWVKRQKLIGNPIPSDQDELLLQYAKSELIVTFPVGDGAGSDKSDFSQLSMTCQGLAFTGLSEEAEERWRSSFRRRALRPGNEKGDAAGGVEDRGNGAGLDLQPENVGDRDSGREAWNLAGGIQASPASVEG